MHQGDPARGPSIETRRFLFCSVLLLLFTATFARGQDVAEAARQEQSRKAAQPKASRHVYTEEDLKRQNILTPEDQARVEAQKKHSQPAPAQQNAEQSPNDATPQPESLGEVARRYRRENAARAAEQAEKKKFTPFPYEVPAGSLAIPKPGVAPKVEPTPRLDLHERAAPSLVPAPRSAPSAPFGHSRISPFRPRPFTAAPPVPRVTPPVAPLPGANAPPMLPVIPHAAPSRPVLSPGKEGLRPIQVRRGESWWKLAESYLGNGARWQELRSLNPEHVESPELLKLGSMVLIPENAYGRSTAIPRSITVKKGDSLWSLARQHLGHGSAWTCMAQANPQIKDYLHIAIGAPLQLPVDAPLESCPMGSTGHLQR